MLPIPNPVAFDINGFEIRWYAITMVLGILLGLIVALRRLPRFDISEDSFLNYFLCLIPFAIIGARAYYVIFEWDYYGNNLDQIINIRSGGLAIHGAIIAGALVTIVYCYYKKYNILKFFDLLVPSLALGQAIGRWGNYFNMEAHGRMTDLPWAIPVYNFADEVIYVHPTFLYESIVDLLLFFFLLYFENKRETKCGQATCLYLIFYSFARFFIEGLRTDSLLFFGLRQAQIISIILLLVGLIGLIIIHFKGKPFTLLSKEEAREVRVKEKEEIKLIKEAKKKAKLSKKRSRPKTLPKITKK